MAIHDFDNILSDEHRLVLASINALDDQLRRLRESVPHRSLATMDIIRPSVTAALRSVNSAVRHMHGLAEVITPEAVAASVAHDALLR